MSENDVVKNRYDFIALIDVENGNPNGDPDAAGLPRIDPETSNGLITDVCLKRKIRNYVDVAMEGTPRYRIYVKQGRALETNDKEAMDYVGVDDIRTIKKKDPDADKKLKEFMCSNFFDIRAFGGVMATFMQGALNCGQIRGPVQISMARSVDPVILQELSITRVAITREDDLLTKHTEMGRKAIVPYGLYMFKGYVSPFLAKETGFTEGDLNVLWKALQGMLELDHSASRGNMAMHDLIVFKHESPLGKAPAYQLFNRVQVKKLVDTPRSYSDYAVTVNETDMPEGVSILRLK